MIVKEILREIKKQSFEFELEMERLNSKIGTGEAAKYDEFYTLIKKYKLHPRILDSLADQMLIENDESLISKYSLEDVEDLQNINLKINPSDVVVLASYIHYQYLTKDVDQLEMNLIDGLIKELEELKQYLNEKP